LNKIFAEKGRHETIWIILRKFHYTDSLSLQDTFLHPKFDVPQFASAELSPSGYRFFVDLFLKFDHDNDGGLNDEELANLFAPTPGVPSSWIDSAFPSCTVRTARLARAVEHDNVRRAKDDFGISRISRLRK
jgi:Ras family protein T1